MKVTLQPIRGSKKSSGSSGAPYESPNTLLSVNTARLVEAICAGPIKGPVNGLQSTYIDKTPVQNDDGSYNFTGFSVFANLGESNQPALPGFNGVSTVYDGPGVEIEYGLVSSIRTITGTDIDEVRVTINCPQFTEQDTKTGALKGSSVEYVVEVRPYNLSAVTDVRTGADQVAGNKHIGLASLTGPDTGLVGAEVTGTGIPAGTTCDAVHIDANPALSFFSISKDPTSTIGSNTVTFRKYNANWKEASKGTISGKCTSPYTFDVSILLSSEAGAYGTGPWQIRVRRLTADSVSAAVVNKIYWTYYTEVKHTKLRYPKVAHFGYSFDAKTFSSLPDVVNHLDLRLIKIPMNYDPYARTYATTGPGTTGGVWDGTFKVDWSNCPAWVYYDLCTDGIDGLGEILPEEAIDKFELYAIGQYCDGLVPDGRGGTEPRMTCNLFLQTREAAIKVLANLASVFRGITYWASNSAKFAQDRPGIPIYDIYGPSNVRGGAFSYSGTAKSSRTNRVIVYYNDPENFSKSTPVLVEDEELQGVNGIIEKTITAFGCASPGQARRAGLWMIYSDNYESDQVQFETATRALRLDPGALIYISDPLRAVDRWQGRMLASSSGSITIDAPVEIEASPTYTVYFRSQDGVLMSRVLTNTPAAGVTVLTFTPTLSGAEIPLVGTEWLISVSDNVPALFRVIGVSPTTKPWYRVTAVKHNLSKFDYVEQNLPLEFPPDSPLLGTVFVAPATDLSLTTQYVSVPENTERRITASWTHSVDRNISYYRVNYRFESGEWLELGTTTTNSYEFKVIEDGVYTVRVIAVNKLHRPSAPLIDTITLDEDPITTGTITSLGLEGGGTTFTGTSPAFVWSYTKSVESPDTVAETDVANNPFLKGYKVKIYATADLGTLLYESIETEPYFVFDYELNHRVTSGAPIRAITIKVTAVSLRDNESAVATFAATNATPLLGAAPPTHDPTKFTITSQGSLVQFEYTAPAGVDFSGVAIWVSTDPGFDLTDVRLTDGALPEAAAMIPYDPVADTGMLLYLGSDTKIQAILKAGTFYVIYAPLDTFGFSGAKCYGPEEIILSSSSDAQFVSLTANETAFTRANSAASFAPASILLTALPFGFGTPTYAWHTLDPDGVTWNSLAGTTATQTIASGDFAGSSQAYRVTLTEGAVTRRDTITLYKVTGGTNAVTAYLTNESHTVPASAAGVVSSWTGAGGTFKIYVGATDVSGSASFSVAANADGLSGGFTGANYAYTGPGSWADASDTTTITLRAAYGGVNYDKVFTLTKARSGVAGVSGINALLSNTSHGIPTNAAGGSPNFTGAVSTMTVLVGGSDDSANWTFSQTLSNVTVTASGSPANRTATITGISADTGYVDFTATRSGYPSQTQRFTLYKAKAGTNGNDGIARWLICSALAVQKNQAGTFVPASITFTGKMGDGGTLADYTGRIAVAETTDGTNYSDVDAPASDRSFATRTVSGGTLKAIRGRLYLAGAYTTLVDEIIVPIVVDGPTGTAAQYVNVSTTGGNVFARANSSSSYAPTSITLLATPTGIGSPTYQWQYWNGSSWVNSSLTGNTTNTITVPSSEPNPSREYRCAVGGGAATVYDNVTLFQVTGGTNGTNGSNGITAFLTNESHTVPASNAGVVSSYTGCSGTFKVYDGATDVTASATFSVVSNPDTVTTSAPTAGTGAYSVTASGSWANATLVTTVTYRATYNSVNYDRVFSITKAVAGATGTTGDPGPGVVYRGTYATGNNYFHTSTRRDIVLYSGSYYLTNNTGLNGSNGTTWGLPSGGNWTAFGASFSSVATDILLAQQATIAETLVMGDGSTADKGILRSAGATAFATGAGYWLNPRSSGHSNAAVFRVGNPGVSEFKYDGTTASVLGTFSTGTADGTVTMSGATTTFGNTSNRHILVRTPGAGMTSITFKNGATVRMEHNLIDIGGGTIEPVFQMFDSSGALYTQVGRTTWYINDVNWYRKSANVWGTDDTVDAVAVTTTNCDMNMGSAALDCKAANFRVFSDTGKTTQTARIDNTTGYYYVQNNKVIGTPATGWTTTPSGTLTRTAFTTSTVTLPELAERVAALINDLHVAGTANHGILKA